MVTHVFFHDVIQPLCASVDTFHGITLEDTTWPSVIGGELCGRGVYALAMAGEIVTIPIDIVFTAMLGIGALFSALVLRQDFFFKTFENCSTDIEQHSMIFMALLLCSLSFRSIFSQKKSSTDISSFSEMKSLIKKLLLQLNERTKSAEACWESDGTFTTTRWDVTTKAVCCPVYRISELVYGLLYTAISLCTLGIFRKTSKSQDLTLYSVTVISAPLSLPFDMLSYLIQFVKPKKILAEETLA